MRTYTLLGPVGVVGDEGRTAPSAAKPRALLALLLLHANRSVPLDRIVDELWPEHPPETAAKAVQTYVSQLRKLVGESSLEHRASGYRLDVPDDELDTARFEGLLARGQAELAADDVATAARTLASALGLWHGRALEDVDAPFAHAEASRLENLRLDALEARYDCELRLGRHQTVAAELERLSEAEPERERLVELAMLALYRSGRQADALALYRRARARLADELGLEPGRRLVDLERAILQRAPELDLPAGPPRGAADAQAAPPPGRRPRRAWVVVTLAGAAVLAAVASFVLLGRTDGSPAPPPSPPPPPLRPFVVKLEGFLVQSGEGRAMVGRLVREASRCALPAPRALTRLASVERNRQSLLEQVAALTVPDDPGAVEVSRRFQRAIQTSMAADSRYREWLEGLDRCTPAAAASSLRATAGQDAQATAAKEAFLERFNPLARRYGRRTWSADAF